MLEVRITIEQRRALRWFHPAVLILPVLYMFLIVVTAVSSTEPYAYNRVDGSNPFAGGFLMIAESVREVVIVQLLTGTPWWYLVGLTAYSAKKRIWAIGATLFSLFTFLTATLMTLQVLKQDPDRALLPLHALVQYGLLVLLCLGALMSCLYASATAVRCTRGSQK